MIEEYKKIFCPYCKNRDSQECEIRIGVDNKPRCQFYELDKEKLRENHGQQWNFVQKRNK